MLVHPQLRCAGLPVAQKAHPLGRDPFKMAHVQLCPKLPLSSKLEKAMHSFLAPDKVGSQNDLLCASSPSDHEVKGSSS